MEPKLFVSLTSFAIIVIAVIAFLIINRGMVLAMGDKKAVLDEETFALQRKQMVERQIANRGVIDEKVLEAMEAVPRHLFIPEPVRYYSYFDQPVPIGHGQTISQPYIVAFMTELLQPDENDVVLEVGTGSGYQAAILARIVKQVYTIEIVEELGNHAKRQLQTMGFDNIAVKIGDGYNGWPECAPFDAIIVTAASEKIPQPLIDQLKPSGRMVIPVGGVFEIQELMLITKDATSKVVKKSIIPVRFVPLTRQ
ncbi:MAG: protein-L-isoaspartate(D-aspartate) O-methyltransferase [Planctomycetes bacterium]|nr:protein-L-isoaspartate(D-aspartate) O-methyltransferase [Planctomycetota bacterium]